MEGEGERAREGKEEEVGREDTFKKRSRSKSKSPFFQATRWNVRGRRAARVFFSSSPPSSLHVDFCHRPFRVVHARGQLKTPQ